MGILKKAKDRIKEKITDTFTEETKKEVREFWKEHKTEILLGAGLLCGGVIVHHEVNRLIKANAYCLGMHAGQTNRCIESTFTAQAAPVAQEIPIAQPAVPVVPDLTIGVSNEFLKQFVPMEMPKMPVK